MQGSGNSTHILVTGVNGFVGKHLVNELKANKIVVSGAGVQPEADPRVAPDLDAYYMCDLTDAEAVAKLPLGQFTAVINLAGLANVGSSFGQAELYKKLNVEVLSVLCARIATENLPLRIMAVSTGAVYDPAQPLPLTEESKTHSTSPYAESKLLMEQAAADFRDKGVDVIVVRPFNHIGPGQEPGFLVPDLIEQVRKALSVSGELKVGNLSTKRDYTDVRDVVRAYRLLATAPVDALKHPIYNICSGRSVSGQDMLENILKLSGLETKITPVTDPAKVRPNDPADIYGSTEKVHADTGWQPEIALKDTLKDIVREAQLGLAPNA